MGYFASTLPAHLGPHWGERWIVLQSLVSIGSAARYRGLLAWCLGDTHRGADLLRRALEVERRMEAKPHEALVRLDLARGAFQDPAAVSRREGAEHLARALALAVQLGMKPIEARARAMALEAEGGGPSHPARA